LNEQVVGRFTVQDTGSVDGDGFGVRAEANGRFGGRPCSERQTNGVCAGTRGEGGVRFVRTWKANTMTDIEKLIDDLVRRLRGRPILEIVTAARQIENRIRDLYLNEAVQKYAADHREEPSRHVVAALHRLFASYDF
jgi:hypothetical protein